MNPSETRTDRCAVPHVSVCICTFRRPDLLARLLDALARQNTGGAFTFDIVIADDDAKASARPLAESFSLRCPVPVVYCNEPRQNIALARNCALRRARGAFAAFVDDDELPEADWLWQLVTCCERTGASAVLGPVRPYFEATPPAWLVRGRFCERPEHPTGTPISAEECRTGNVLLRRSMISGNDAQFREQFGTGGEDRDFFLRMSEEGFRFVWCNEAPVYEVVPPERWSRTFYLRRALLRGRNNLKIPGRRVRLVMTSIVAAPIYLATLSISWAFGQHVFMRYCIRFCDHAGRLLGAVGLNPVKSR